MKIKSSQQIFKSMDQPTRSAYNNANIKRSTAKSSTLSQKMKTLRRKFRTADADQYTDYQDYLVDMTLNRMEILLKHLYSLSARNGNKRREGNRKKIDSKKEIVGGIKKG